MSWFLQVNLLLTLAAGSTSLALAGSTGCANKPCQTQADYTAPEAMKAPLQSSARIDRVKVAKSDGSKQCEPNSKISLEKVQSELVGIPVYEATSKNDGLIYTAVCGGRTGNYYVFEIPKEDLQSAIKLGFKAWLK